MAAIPKIPGYQIQKKLGEGGMSMVYLGIQEKLNRKVAIKILEPSLLKNKVIEIRFLQEAETAANLYHSNIISIYDIGRVDDFNYIVMEYLEETLKEHLLGYPGFCLTPLQAMDILKPIAVALDYAHSRGIIHRDIKTENIMFRADGTPVLTDFGIARALESDREMTKTGMSVGTPYYMSPEQCRAEPLDGRSDIYSLGVVFFEVVTGVKPFDADSPMAVALKHLQDSIPQLPDHLAPYQPLIEKTMAKRKEERVSNGKELVKLMDLVAQQVNQASRTSPAFPAATVISTASSSLESRQVPISSSQTTPQPAAPAFTRMKPAPTPAIITTPVSVKITPPPRKSWLLKEKFPSKRMIEALALAILLGIIFIVFYNLGSKGKETSSPISTDTPSRPVVQPVSPSTSADYFKRNPDYQTTYRHALGFYQGGDYNKALELVNDLKQKKLLPEVAELEEKILQQLQEVEFNNHILNARDFIKQRNFNKARESILLAKKIKITPAVESLERRINAAYTKYQDRLVKGAEQSQSFRQKDRQAYTQAAALNTITAYREYLDDFPSGHHIEEAISRLNKLEEAERLRKEAEKKAAIPRVKLRSKSKTLSLSDVAVMIQRKNFFETEFNQGGSFKNEYKKQLKGEDAVIMDSAADLMWFAGKAPKEMNFKRAEKWIKNLNVQRFGGYGDWRLPTLEEAASLLKKTKNSNALHLAPIFLDNVKSTWTCDLQRTQTYWIVNYFNGIVIANSDLSEQQIQPVRSMR